MKKTLFYVASVCFSLSLLATWLGTQDSPNHVANATRRAHVSPNYSNLPLNFEANQGQAAQAVRFLAHSSSGTLFLTAQEVVLQLPNTSIKEQAAVLRLKLAGSSAKPHIRGEEKLPGVSNYFTGNDPARWQVNVPQYARVCYANVYPGIDLVYYGNQRQLEYDFIVAPGVDPQTIRLEFTGAERMELDPAGNLVLYIGDSQVIQKRPSVYQQIGATRQAIDAGYLINNESQVSFQTGAYNPSYPLVIDPVLAFSTYLGGSGFDQATSIAVDQAGQVYLVGMTASVNFPTLNPYQRDYGANGFDDAFVAKLNQAGTALLYSTYLGGSNLDQAYGIAVDGDGNAHVVGYTRSTNFPLANPLQSTLGGGGATDYDVFVTKLGASGAALAYSTYLGGSDYDFGTAVTVDTLGNTIITGYTDSQNFPTVAPFQSRPFLYPGRDAFITKIGKTADNTNLRILYSTYLGGNGGDYGQAIAVDTEGNYYLAGGTYSTNLPSRPPTQPNPAQPNHAGEYDAFVAKLNPAGAALLYLTYLGGSKTDEIYALKTDVAGNVYVAGHTDSTNFPTVNPLQAAFGGGSFDAFAAKLNPSGGALIFATYLGGNSHDEGFGIAISQDGSIYLSGTTQSTNFPTLNAFQPNYGGGTRDAFVSKLGSGGNNLVYSSFLGGASADYGAQIAVGTQGEAYVIGRTVSTNFPVANALQATSGGGTDAFIARISEAAVPATDLAISKNHLGNFAVGGNGVYTLTVTNVGTAASIGAIIVTDALPAGLAFVSATGSGWNCSAVGQTVTCTFTTPLGINAASSISLIVAVNVAAYPQVVNIATVTHAGDSNAANNRANDPTVVQAPQIELAPTSFNFGEVTAGQSKDLSLSVRNVGTLALAVSALSSNNSRFAVVAPTVPFGVAAGEQQIVSLRFAPEAAEAQTGTLTIASNDPARPSLNLSLTGSGVVPDIAVFPLSHDFGSVLVGQTATTAVTINNPGRGNLSVYAVTSSNPDFSIQLPTVPLTVAAGAAAQLTASFTPTAAAESEATLLVCSNAKDKLVVALPVRGTVPGRPSEILATDDGTVETGIAQDGLIIVNRLTPTSYPTTLRAIRLFIAQFQGLPSPLGKQLRLIAFNDPTGSGQPPANPPLLVNQTVTVPNFPANGGFVEFPIQSGAALNAGAADEVTINAGDLYIGFQAPRPAAGVVFAADATGPQQQRAFFSTNDGTSYVKLEGVSNQTGTVIPVNVMMQGAFTGVGACSYALTPLSRAFDTAGGSVSVNVTAPNGCNWAANNSAANWVAFNTNSGAGNGTLTLSVPASATPRQGVLMIAGQMFTVTQAERVASVSSASYNRTGLAVEAIAAAFGSALATSAQAATMVPLPTSLAGTTLRVRDSSGAERLAPLFFVSPNQINFLVPTGTAPGTATIIIVNGNGVTTVGTAQNDAVAPGLFTANASGKGVAAAVALRVKTDGSQVYEPVARWDATQNLFVPLLLELGPAGEQVFLILYGTGLRQRSSLAAVSVKIGGVATPVAYAGAQGDLVGLDQINVLIPRSLSGRGEVEVTVAADGRNANPVRIGVK